MIFTNNKMIHNASFTNPVKYGNNTIDLFYLMLTGKKTIEGRSKKGIWEKIQKGDIIDFDKVTFKVVKIEEFKGLKDFLDNCLNEAMPRRTYQEAFDIYSKWVGKDINKPFLGIHIKPYTQTIYSLYHGSKTKLDIIKPINDYCFGIIHKYLAASFIPKWNDNDFIHGNHNNKWYMIPRHKNALKILEVDGYVHRLNPKNFYRDEKYGLLEEYVSTKDETVIKSFYVPNVYDYISLVMIIKPFELKWDGGYKFKKHDKPVFHQCAFNEILKPVVIKEGKIIDGLDRAEYSAYVNQEYAYIEI